ncbi:hypothetical protein [Bradyrhizobium sp.]|nr:hypothetical protein [Bradyrhizobium sp.]
MARPFDHVLEKEIECALFAIPNLDLKPEQRKPPLNSYVVVAKLLAVNGCVRSG